MRFSPILLAVFAASAVLNFNRSARAQVSDLPEQSSSAAEHLEIAASTSSLKSSTDLNTILANPLKTGRLPHIDIAVSQPERSAIESLAQANPDATPGSSNETSNETSPASESAPSGGTEAAPSSSPESLPGQPSDPGSSNPTSNDQQDQPILQDQPGTAPPGDQSPQQQTPDQFEFGQPRSGPDLNNPAEVPSTPTTPTPEAPAGTGTQPSTQPGTAPDATAQPEPRVLVGEVQVVGAEGDLLDQVYNAIQTRPGQTTTRSQLQQDINAIFATGFFSNVRAVPSDTPLGVRVTFEVQPNPVLRSVQLQGNALETIKYNGEEVPIQQAVDGIFGDQYGQVLNLRQFQTGVERLNKLYQEDGYVLAQVISAPQVSPDGVVTVEVAEGVIEDIQIRFQDKEGNTVDDKGRPIRGRTRPFIITRQFESKPGDVFNQPQIQSDLQRAFGLGIFEDLQISLNPGQDPRKVDVVVNVVERRTGSLGASAGISTTSGLFGAVSLQEQNLGGNDQDLNAEVQLGQRDVLFDLSFTDPWIGGDPNRTAYTVNAFGRESISLVFDGGGNDDDIELPNGDRPRIRRYGGGVNFSRPLSGGWLASVGLQYQNVSVRDADGVLSPRDEFGTLLSYNDSGIDNLLGLQFSILRDLRNDPLNATSGSFLRLSTEQSIPIDGISYNRLRGSYSYFIPVQFTRFTQGCRKKDPTAQDCPQALAFNVQAGTYIGSFPPYEAFVLGGSDSVRGYGPGRIGSGSSFVQGTIEYRFPLISVLSGALFVDAATNLGTGSEVRGNPTKERDLPGSGLSYGLGLRVQSPLGQIRIDYAINDQGDSRFDFGIGQRF